LAIVCCIAVLLEVADCTGYMAAGGPKDGTFIANEMRSKFDKIGANNLFLVIFDGASSKQPPIKPLVLPAALASVQFGFILVRVRVRVVLILQEFEAEEEDEEEEEEGGNNEGE
jgi:hypothetical protein